MGGQACILYGAAEFSRDVDVAVAVGPVNLARLRAALAELEAEPVYFPRLDAAALRRGHACHFRCHGPGLSGVRLDVMSVLRGVAPFADLWRRRVRVGLPDGSEIEVMAVEDLVRAKKTQRDKDWPMVRRLVESDVVRGGARPHASRVRFWLRECRTPVTLHNLVVRFPRAAAAAAARRAAIRQARRGDLAGVERALRAEEDRERAADRKYWAPLLAELESLRRARHRDEQRPDDPGEVDFPG
jgi:hypothetical protein